MTWQADDKGKGVHGDTAAPILASERNLVKSTTHGNNMRKSDLYAPNCFSFSVIVWSVICSDPQPP